MPEEQQKELTVFDAVEGLYEATRNVNYPAHVHENLKVFKDFVINEITNAFNTIQELRPVVQQQRVENGGVGDLSWTGIVPERPQEGYEPGSEAY